MRLEKNTDKTNRAKEENQDLARNPWEKNAKQKLLRWPLGESEKGWKFRLSACETTTVQGEFRWALGTLPRRSRNSGVPATAGVEIWRLTGSPVAAEELLWRSARKAVAAKEEL